MKGQLPIFLSADAARLLEWARETVDYRNASSQIAPPEQIPRITLRPGRLYQDWFLAGQFCMRHVTENLVWTHKRAEIARRELFVNGLVREDGYFRYEVTALGRQLELEPCAVVAVA